MPNKSQPITARTLVQYVPDRPGAVVVDGLTRGLVRDGTPFIVTGFFGSAADDQMLEREAQNAWTALFTSDPTVFQSRAEAVGIGVVLGLASVVEFMEAWPAPRGGADAMYTALEAQVRSVRGESALPCTHFRRAIASVRWRPLRAQQLRRWPGGTLSVQVARHSYLLLKLWIPTSLCSSTSGACSSTCRIAVGMVPRDDRGATLPNGFDAYLTTATCGRPIRTSSARSAPTTAIRPSTSARHDIGGHGHVAGELLGGVKPLHLIIQAFGGRSAWLRPAQPRELRVMTYLALAHGATGVYFFSSRGSAPMTEPGASPWRQASELATELFGIGPSLLSPSPTTTPTVVAKPIGTKQPSSVRVRAFAV